MIKHGMSNTLMYRRWSQMIQRCTNPNNDAYKNYGGRGVSVHGPWLNDFKAFYDYVSRLSGFDDKGMTLDRYPDNNGNYEPGNLRWATRQQQQINSRKFRSKYVGVFYELHNSRMQWVARISVKNKTKFIGWYKTAKDAAIGRDEYIIKHNLTEYPLKFIKDTRKSK